MKITLSREGKFTVMPSQKKWITMVKTFFMSRRDMKMCEGMCTNECPGATKIWR